MRWKADLSGECSDCMRWGAIDEASKLICSNVAIPIGMKIISDYLHRAMPQIFMLRQFNLHRMARK